MEIKSVKIKFVGKTNTIYNVVSEEMFKKEFEPKGWVLADASVDAKESEKENVVENSEQLVDSSLNENAEEIVEEKTAEEIVQELKTTDEEEIKNINASVKKHLSDKKFNDKIIKE